MKLLLTLFFTSFFACVTALAQFDAVPDDSLATLIKTKYTAVSTQRLKAEFELLLRKVPGEHFFDSLANVMIAEAETSRDRALMCMAYNYLADDYFDFPNKNGATEKGRQYTERCQQIAEESGLDMYKTAAFIEWARYYNWLSQNQKALDYNNQALSLATATGNDSLVAEAYKGMADTWDFLSNKLSRFQALLSFRDFAEKSGSRILILQSYKQIADFYNSVEEYEKAKDVYAQLADKGREWGYWGRVVDGMRGMGKVFVEQKNDSLGLAIGKKAFALADSVKMPVYKINLNLDLLNYYLNSGSPGKGLEYIKSNPSIADFVGKLGIGYEFEKVRAFVLFTNKKYDSALAIMQRISPEYFAKPIFYNKYRFTILWCQMLKEAGRHTEELQKLLLAKSFADSAHALDNQQEVTESLYQYYETAGDYKQALDYYKKDIVYKDSLDKLSKQKDLLTVEIENTNKRIERQKLKEEEATRTRNNLQYMGITAAIATVFIFLVILGVFKMSANIIKALGFFAFIFLFEFIVLLLDNQIHELTGEEPWKVLGVKIIIIAFLLPLHHKLEERVTHYLTSKAHKLRESLRLGGEKHAE